jgi:plastocyanin
MASKKKIAIGILLAAVLVLAGCSSASQVGADEGTKSKDASSSAEGSKLMSGHALVKITDTGFSPATVKIKPGGRVVWTNDGKQSHDIMFGTGGVKSPAIEPGKSANHQFKTAGTFQYTDSKNPAFKGTVIVK